MYQGISLQINLRKLFEPKKILSYTKRVLMVIKNQNTFSKKDKCKSLCRNIPQIFIVFCCIKYWCTDESFLAYRFITLIEFILNGNKISM